MIIRNREIKWLKQDIEYLNEEIDSWEDGVNEMYSRNDYLYDKICKIESIIDNSDNETEKHELELRIDSYKEEIEDNIFNIEDFEDGIKNNKREIKQKQEKLDILTNNITKIKPCKKIRPSSETKLTDYC